MQWIPPSLCWGTTDRENLPICLSFGQGPTASLYNWHSSSETQHSPDLSQTWIWSHITCMDVNGTSGERGHFFSSSWYSAKQHLMWRNMRVFTWEIGTTSGIKMAWIFHGGVMHTLGSYMQTITEIWLPRRSFSKCSWHRRSVSAHQ